MINDYDGETKKLFYELCEILDEKKWKYRKDERELSILINVIGDDLPMPFKIVFYDEGKLFALVSPVAALPQDKIALGAVIVSAINYKLAEGCFDLNTENGQINFRNTTCYAGCLIDAQMFFGMVNFSCVVVDKYNDILANYASGEKGLDETLALIAKE